MDQEILKLANISYNLNNPVVGDNIMHLNLDRTYSIRIIKGVFDIKENTAYVTDKTPNANLFFHPWLFTLNENIKFSDVKYPYIGIFHPYGSIYAHNNSNYLNKLEETCQDYHNPASFSPNNSHIYIDHLNIGKAIVACIDWNKSIPDGRIELLISLTKGMKNILNHISLQNKTCFELINELLFISVLKSLLITNDLKSLFNKENINLISDPISEYRADYKVKGLFMFDYTGNSKEYNKILHVNFPIENKNIPYFEEIKNNLPVSIRDKVIWEFGIQIITPYN
jgi:hypothetical protein